MSDRAPAGSDTSAPLSVGVIGVGHMGQYHARVYSELPGVQFVGVADIDPTRASQLAGRFGVESYGYSDLLGRVDAVSVAVPTEAHVSVVEQCIDAGVAVLVEKPFVLDPAEGRRLLDRANERGVTIQVGHIERFNPAVVALRDVLHDHDLIAVDANRLGPRTSRDIDDDVVMDLMIHDLDVVLSLADGDVASADCVLARDEQYATATLVFDDDLVGTFTASRVTQRKVRELVVTAEECVIYLDYTGKSVDIYRRSTPSYVEEDEGVTQRHESRIEQVYVENREPLEVELYMFVKSVRNGTQPSVTAEDGIRAVELVKRLHAISAGRSGRHPGD
jgi:predicted dehydrogenase